MNDTIFRILAAVILVTAAAISIYHRHRANRESGEKISIADEGLPIMISLRVFGFALWASVFAYLINPDWMAWSSLDLPEWARWIGVGMGCAGAALAYWVFTNLGNNVSPTVVTRTHHSLVTSGPYHWVRHPLYSMGIIAYTGYALISENWLIAVLAVLSFLILAVRTRNEEAHLIDRFGDEYRQYMRRTGKYFPRLMR
jgi:protein-S-isoprenylcysteine O-methyltransferase Ste14